MSAEAQAAGLQVLLIASLVASILCASAAILMTGAKLILRQYQRTAGINGTSRIQSTINIRTYAMRVFVGITFGLFAALLWADAPVMWRQWVNRSLFVLVPLLYFVATLLDWIAEQEQMRLEFVLATRIKADAHDVALAEEEKRTATLRADLADYQAIAAEAVENLRIAAAQAREARGEASMPEMAPVVPEHHSPVTPEQQAVAEKQTLRAGLTASTLDLGLPVREAPPPPSRRPAVSPAIGQSLGDMAAAAGETLEAAEKTVVAAETAVEAIEDERAGRETP